MRLRLVGTLLFVIVGMAAIFITLFPPGASSGADDPLPDGGSDAHQRREAGRRDRHGCPRCDVRPRLRLAAGASTSSSSSASSGNGNNTVSWRVTTVAVTPGQSVASGNVLATADDSDAQLALTVAQANLASAKAKLSTDKAGLSATDKAAAKLSVTQAQPVAQPGEDVPLADQPAEQPQAVAAEEGGRGREEAAQEGQGGAPAEPSRSPRTGTL